MKVWIDIGNGPVDYTRYVADGSLSVEDSINVPTILNFNLTPTDNSFIPPPRSSYVTVESEFYQATQYTPTNAFATASYPSMIIGALAYTCSFSGTSSTGEELGQALTIIQNVVQLYQITVQVAAVCQLFVPAAGNYNLSVAHRDGVIFAIQGASVVSGPANNNPAGQIVTPLRGYSFTPSSWGSGVAAASNVPGSSTDNYVINFPTAGTYNMEYGWCTGDTGYGATGVSFQTGPSSDIYVPEYVGQDLGAGVFYLLGNVNAYVLCVALPQNTYFTTSGCGGTYSQQYANYGEKFYSVGNPSNDYTTQKILATGFISNLPGVDYLGLSPQMVDFGFQQLSYKVNVTSDEWLLNCKTVPYIPAYINRTQGQILASIAEVLAPGFFNVTAFVGSGDLVPYYQYSPDQTWSDIAKSFGDSSRYRYKVINRVVYYQPFGDQPLGILYDERTPQSQWFPLQMASDVVTVPPVNDALVIGAVEPQANWENYFIGDGFTSQFRLLHEVFDGATDLLLQDDWTEDQFQTQLWTVYPTPGLGGQSPFNLDDSGQAIGALNVLTGSGSYTIGADSSNPAYILSLNGVELGGGLVLQHGQIEFQDICTGGIVGGLYQDESLTLDSCLAGFATTAQVGASSVSVAAVGTASGTFTVDMQVNTAVTLPIGTVIRCAGFTSGAASGLNYSTTHSPFTVQSISQAQQNGATVWVVQLIGDYLFPTTQIFTEGGGAVLEVLAGDVAITASGTGGIVMQPIYNGMAVGTQVVSVPNHQYILQTWIGAERWDRYERIYRNIIGTAAYGGNNLAASGTITWVISDYDQGIYAITPQYLQQTIVPTITKYTVQQQDLPEFAVYAPCNVGLQNYQLNYTAIYDPPQGTLFVRALTGASEYQISELPPVEDQLDPSIINYVAPTGGTGIQLPVLPQNLGPEVHYTVGFGMALQTATVLANGDTNYLAFYNDTIPGVGARIRYQSWAAGESMARVVDSVAVANEAIVSGDSGVRSAIFTNLSPQPLTSSECELAAAAAILDDEYPQFQGTYTVESIPTKFLNLYNPGLYDYPVPGRYLYAYSPYRGITAPAATGSALGLMVNTSRIQVTELREEVLQLALDYGPDLYLEKMLAAFIQRTDSLLTPTETLIPPNPIDLEDVGNFYLDTPDSATITVIQNSSVTGNTVVIDLSGNPAVAPVDVTLSPTDGVGGSDWTNLANAYDGNDATFASGVTTYNALSEGKPATFLGFPTAPYGTTGVVLNVLVSSAVSGSTTGVVNTLQYNLNEGQTFDFPGFNQNQSNSLQTLSVGLSDTDAASISVTAQVYVGVSGNGMSSMQVYEIWLQATGAGAVSTPVEIRKVDKGWGNSDPNQLIGIFTTDQVVLPRTYRDQTWFLRFKNGSQYSRFSRALRVVYPMIPSSPILQQIVTAPGQPLPLSTEIVFDFNGYVADIYGLELRAPQLSGISFIETPQEGIDTIAYFTREALGVYPYSPNGNANAIYSPVGNGTPSPYTFQVGDVALLTCQQDSSFNKLVLVTDDAAGSTGGVNTVRPTIGAGTFQSLSYAYDGDPSTASVGVGHNYPIAGDPDPVEQSGVWYGFPAASVTPLTLNVQSSAQIAGNDGQVILSYSLNGGADGFANVIYDFNTSPGSRYATDQVTLPSDQDLTQVQVQAKCLGFGSTTNSSCSVFEIWIGSGTPSSDYNQFSWYDTGAVTNQGANAGGQAQLYETAETVTPLASASISGSIATMVTSNPHGYSVGQPIINGCAWVQPAPANQNASMGAVMCGQNTVSNVIDDVTFQIPLANYSFGDTPSSSLVGSTATLPANTFSGSASGGVLLQRVVFSPSDLVVDLTQPPIAGALSLLEAINGGSRVTGLYAYFFNLTWDYSQPLNLPGFAVPQVTGLIINPNSAALQWGLASAVAGQDISGVIGHRIETFDLQSGYTASRYTVDHPLNPVPLRTSPMPYTDYLNPRTFKVTPFDALGDGIPAYVTWPGISGISGGIFGTVSYIGTTGLIQGGPITQSGILDVEGSGNSLIAATATTNVSFAMSGDIIIADGFGNVSGSSVTLQSLIASETYTIGTTYDGLLNASGIVLARIPLDQAIQFAQNFVPSQAYLESPPTSGNSPWVVNIYRIPAEEAPSNAVLVGTCSFTSSSLVGVYSTVSSSGAGFNEQDVIKVVTPNVADTQAANIGMTLSAIKG